MKRLMIVLLLLIMATSVLAETVVDVTITDPQDSDVTCADEICVYGFATAVGGGGELDVIFVMDTSGSMGWNDPSEYRKIGAKALIDVLPEGTQVAIAVEDFDSWATVVLPFTDDHAAAKAAIDALDAAGGTDIGYALEVANSYMIANGRVGAAHVEILFTDGDDSSNTATPAATAAANSIVIHTMGLGSGVNAAKLQAIADTTGGTYTYVDDPANLPNVFPALSLTNIVGVTVNGNAATLYPNGNFEYCWLPLSFGPNTIIAEATATDQTTGFDEITVERTDICGEPGDIPEFTVIGAGLALLGAAGFIAFKKRK